MPCRGADQPRNRFFATAGIPGGRVETKTRKRARHSTGQNSMTQLIAIPDAHIIPMRAESILARRWAAKAAEEGHKPRPPSDETANRQNARKGAQAAMARHYMHKIGMETQSIALDAIRKGHTTVPRIAKAIDRPTETTRKAVRNLASRGLVECVGKVRIAGGQANIWKVKT